MGRSNPHEAGGPGIHVFGRAVLLRRPRIQGIADAPPLLEVENSCPAPRQRKQAYFLFAKRRRIYYSRHIQLTSQSRTFGLMMPEEGTARHMYRMGQK